MFAIQDRHLLLGVALLGDEIVWSER